MADDALQTLVSGRVFIAVHVVTVARVFDENHHRLRVRLNSRPLSANNKNKNLFNWRCVAFCFHAEFFK